MAAQQRLQTAAVGAVHAAKPDSSNASNVWQKLLQVCISSSNKTSKNSSG
jgi:hypothetical protein